jgi:eukaryotic-like serine/threonine-protein kinase
MHSTKLRRTLKGDLDNIVLKAPRKEPARRYASVEQLAEDIRRHLDGLPVTATPDSASYRVSKFVRRHKAGVAATALVAVAIAGGVVTTLREARVAVQQRARAERRFNDVRKLANTFLFEFDDAIRNLPGSTPARSLVVNRALEYLDGLAGEARGDRSLQLEIATAYQKVAEVQGDPMFPNLGDSKGAVQSSRKALAILETLSHAEPEDQQVQLATASNHQQISDVLHFSGDTAGAVEHSGEALKIYESLAGKLEKDSKFQTERVIQTYHYANLLQLAGGLDKAATEYGQAVALSRRLVAARPSDPDGKIHLATSLDGLGNVLQEKGDTAGALENRRGGLMIREELSKLDPNNAHYRRQLAFSHHNVGLSLVEAGDMASALTNFRQELTLFESLSAADPKDVQGRRNRSLAHKQIGDLLMRTGNIHEVLVHYRAALEIDRGLVSTDPSNSQAVLDLSFSESKVGSALGKLGQMAGALVLLRSGIARQETLIASDPHHILLYNHLANSYTLLARSLLENGQRKTAIEYYRKAIAARLALTEKSPSSITNRGALAECYSNLAQALGPSDREDARTQFDNAIQQLERIASADRSNTRYRIALAEALSNTARFYARAASAEPSNSLQCWTKAKSFYEHSQELWLELDNAGKLSPTRRRVIPALNEELARCKDSLAKLQQSH